jgi:6,7-dimethyl-8-ribityllumazine synthase
MAGYDKNQSLFETSDLPDASGLHMGIVVAEWNREITEKLFKGAVETLKKAGISDDHLHIIKVPGTFELPSGARFLSSTQKVNAVICLGCVIQGETRHFEFICQSVAQGLIQLSLLSSIPCIFGVLTTDTIEQAHERTGGKHGHKGVEAAVTALRMSTLKSQVKSGGKIGF